MATESPHPQPNEGLNRYAFDEVFDYYPETDIIMPKFTVVINGVISKKGVPIRQGDQGLAGEFNNEMLTIKGLYP